MTRLLEYAILSRNEDIPRFIGFYEEKISDKIITNYIKTFMDTKSKIKKQKTENSKKHKKKQDSLAQLILMKYDSNNKSTFFDHLAQKYGMTDNNEEKLKEGKIKSKPIKVKKVLKK